MESLTTLRKTRPLQAEVFASHVTSRHFLPHEVVSPKSPVCRKGPSRPVKNPSALVFLCLYIIYFNHPRTRSSVLATSSKRYCVVSVWCGGDSEKTIPQRAEIVQLCV